MKPPFKTTAYRYPTEDIILYLTLVALGVIVLFITGTTIFTGLFFILLFMGVSFIQAHLRHETLRKNRSEIPIRDHCKLIVLKHECATKLQVEPINILVSPSDQLNAYAFGLSSPKVVVLFSELINVMDANELRFIIGHEFGHIHLGHTTLNTVVGGLAGTPGSYWASTLLRSIFRYWNRLCEFSADRAGMLACGDPEKAVSALLKLASQGKARTRTELVDVMKRLEKEEGSPVLRMSEVIYTHPLIYKRIRQIHQYAHSKQYRELQKKVNENFA